jgi:hypothetical protein
VSVPGMGRPGMSGAKQGKAQSSGKLMLMAGPRQFDARRLFLVTVTSSWGRHCASVDSRQVRESL